MAGVPPAEHRERMACPACGFIAYVNPRLVVTTIPVTDAGEAVLIRRGIEPGYAGLPTGWFEIEPDAIVAAVQSVLQSLAQTSPDARGILVAGQMGGLILVNVTGRPLSNYRSWRDQRTLGSHPSGGTYLQAARAAADRQTVRRARQRAGPGLRFGSRFLVGRARRAFARRDSHHCRRLRHGPAVRRGPMDAPHARHRPVAPRQRPVASRGAGRSGPGRSHVAAAGERARTDRQDVDRRALLSVLSALGDQQCALSAASGLHPDELSLNISTGSQVSRRTAAASRSGPYHTRPYFGGEYLNTITHLPAGRSLNVLVDLLTELAATCGDRRWQTSGNYIAEASTKANRPIPQAATCDLAFFAGPHGKSGSSTGITTENLTVGNLFHAAFRTWPTTTSAVPTVSVRRARRKQIRLSGGLTNRSPSSASFSPPVSRSLWPNPPRKKRCWACWMSPARSFRLDEVSNATADSSAKSTKKNSTAMSNGASALRRVT